MLSGHLVHVNVFVNLLVTHEIGALIKCTPYLFSAESHYLCLYATPTCKDLDSLVVGEVAYTWETVAIQLGVEQSLIAIVARNNPRDCEGACRDVFDRWLKGERSSSVKERTWHALLEALKRSGFGTLAIGLRRQMVEQESRGGFLFELLHCV